MEGTNRTESLTPVDLRPGGYILLGRAVVGIGTYENVVGRPPQEGHKVVRLRRGSKPAQWGPPDYRFADPPPWEFATTNLLVHTFTDGAWVPEAPQLNIGEAAWFYAPPPLLHLSMGGTYAALSWPMASIDMQLQYASQFGNPITWTNVIQAPATNGTQVTVTVPVNPAQPQFYRLRSKL